MKEKIFSKKKFLGFSPEFHWDLMILTFFLMLVGVSIYFSYLYVTLNKRIESTTATLTNETGKANEEQSIQKIINMEGVIAGYREKEKAYTATIDALSKKIPAPEVKISTSTASSTVVATSTVR